MFQGTGTIIRLGLRCIFTKAPIRFRRTTASYQAKFSRVDQLRHISDLCLHNAEALMKALSYCRKSGFVAFRINSQILPLFHISSPLECLNGRADRRHAVFIDIDDFTDEW